MPIFKQLFSSFYLKTILSVFLLIAFTAILYIAFIGIEHTDVLKNIALTAAIIIILLVFLLFFFLKTMLKDRGRIKKLEAILEHLEFELEKFKDAADMKMMYLANMSHEIRTPLNTVIGMINMLKQTDLDGDQTTELEIAEYSSLHLLQLVNMILDNSKANGSDLRLSFGAMSLKKDFSRLFKIFEYQAMDKGLEFEVKFLSEQHDKFSVLGDLAKIQQVIINLINNAIKFTDSGKISIIIDQSVGVDEHQIVTFYVKDTGAGMRAYEVKDIFKASKNLESLSIENYKGRGMGLLISHQLVTLMGGELKIESKENEGTTFYFSLQLKKTLNIKGKTIEAEPFVLNRFSVLIAEDNRMHQKVIKFLLEQLGADCTFAKNGFEAVELYKLLDFDMVFMDIYMPNIDGYEATKKIKNSKKYASRNIPVIGVSASAFSKDISNAKLAGIDDFLSKPIEVPKLRELIIKHASVNKTA